MVACIGFDNLHSTLSDNISFEEYLQKNIKGSGLEVVYDNEIEREEHEQSISTDVWSKFLGEEKLNLDDKNKKIVNDRIPEYTALTLKQHLNAEANGSAEIPSYNVSILNKSEQGYRIHWAKMLITSLYVGDIVGIYHHKQQCWQLCLIVWLQSHEQHVATGLRILSNNAYAVAAKKSNVSDSKKNFHKVMITPPQPEFNQGKISLL
jgi:hypothetical protein